LDANLKANGLYTYTIATCILVPPLCINEAQLDEGLKIMDQALLITMQWSKNNNIYGEKDDEIFNFIDNEWRKSNATGLSTLSIRNTGITGENSLSTSAELDMAARAAAEAEKVGKIRRSLNEYNIYSNSKTCSKRISKSYLES
jgi:hypothetical protein